MVIVLLLPFIPESCEKIAKHFNFKISLEELKNPLKNLKIKKAPIFFPKVILDLESETQEQKPNKEEVQNKSMENVSTIQFEDFAKLDLRVAKIIAAEEIPKADKLWKLTLDVGELGQRTICAGIKEFYSSEELQNKTIIIIANLAPRKLRGIESQGMLLAASSEDKKKVSLISPDQDMQTGSRVG